MYSVVSGEPDEVEQRILSDLVTEIKQKKFSVGMFVFVHASAYAVLVPTCAKRFCACQQCPMCRSYRVSLCVPAPWLLALVS
jgi:hypothetical protein